MDNNNYQPIQPQYQPLQQPQQPAQPVYQQPAYGQQPSYQQPYLQYQQMPGQYMADPLLMSADEMDAEE